MPTPTCSPGLFGDEIALRRDLVGLDMGNRAELGKVFTRAFQRLYFDLDPAAQEKAIAEGLGQALAVSKPVLTAHCEVARRIGERLGLPEEISRNLGQIYERWDGKGLPQWPERRGGAARGARRHAGAGRDRAQRRAGA